MLTISGCDGDDFNWLVDLVTGEPSVVLLVVVVVAWSLQNHGDWRGGLGTMWRGPITLRWSDWWGVQYLKVYI